MPQQMSRGEMQDLLAKFSLENPKYRENLLKNPRDIIARQFEMKLPANVSVKVVEETADVIYVVLPHLAKAGAELSDSELESVAGGMNLVKTANCDHGMLSTVVSIGS